MLHLRTFVANEVLSPISVLLGLFSPDFYSDSDDFTQILCRNLPKKLVAKTFATAATMSGGPKFKLRGPKSLGDQSVSHLHCL